MIKLYSKFLDLLEWVEKAILAVSVFVMVIIMVYQVILRYVFSNPNAWSEELARYLFILNVMLAAAIAVRRNSHMQIDILINLFSERVKHIFTIISTIAGIGFMVLLFQYSLGLCATGAANVTPGLKIPMSIPYASIPIGVALMILTSIEVILKSVEALVHPQEVSDQ